MITLRMSSLGDSLVSTYDLSDLMDEFVVPSDTALWPNFSLKSQRNKISLTADISPLSAEDIFVDLSDEYVCVSSAHVEHSFKKEFTLPFSVDLGKVTITIRNGKLRLLLLRTRDK